MEHSGDKVEQWQFANWLMGDRLHVHKVLLMSLGPMCGQLAPREELHQDSVWSRLSKANAIKTSPSIWPLAPSLAFSTQQSSLVE